MRNVLLSLSVILAAAFNLRAQTKVSLDCMDSIPVWMSQSKVPVLGVGIIENARLKEVKMFGELRQGVPAPDNTLFNVASLTKPVVAMTTLKLVNAGQWKLDEPLDAYWIDPDIKDDPRHSKLTSRVILTHQTGFPNWRDQKLAFGFEPGTRFGYSGEGFEYLRKALENRFGRTLQQLSDSLLFAPLGMEDTRYGWGKGKDTSGYATPHDGNGAAISIPRHETPNAADWLVTTVADYTKFGAYVLQGAGLSDRLFADMATPRGKMGLGWGIQKGLPNGEYMLMHTGHDPGVSTIIVLLPKTGRGLVLLTNGDKAKELFLHIIAATLHIEGLGG
jgi:CubicO group peptidase (beta-lactamase class C family)